MRTYNYTSVTVGSKVEPALLSQLTDENLTPFATWTYDTSALAASSEHAGAVDKYTVTYQKDVNSKITGATVTNPLDAVSNYTFQDVLGARKLTAISHPLVPEANQSFTYDANGNMASRTDFNGNLTTYTYDLARNLETQRVEGAGTTEARTITTEWHAGFRVPLRVAEPLKITTYTYDGSGNVLTKTAQATTDASGGQGFGATSVGAPRVWTWTYNAYGRVLTADGPRSDVADLTTYSYYDAADPDLGKRGNLDSVTNALGHVTQVTAYDLNGRPLTVVDANGLTTQLSYDLRGRLTGKKVGGEPTSYTHDDAGQLTRVTLPDGSYLSYTYDAAHRLTGITDNLGNSISYTLDAAGNRTREEIRDPLGVLTQLKSRIFDALSHLAQEMGALDQTLAQYVYDAQGNLIDVTTPLDVGTRTTSHAYDALNRLIRTTNPHAGQIKYVYNGQDRLTQVTDPRNLATDYAVDGLGNTSQQSSPDTGVLGRSFDAAGNELTQTDAKGQLTSNQYDALNRLTQRTYHDGSRDLYQWDQGANGTGRLTRIEQRDAANGFVMGIDYGYDPLGRVIQETRVVSGVSYVTQYRYTAGRLSGITYPSGKQVDYTRNALGQISEVNLTVGGQVTTLASNVSYHPFGGIKRLTNGAGQTLEWGQDQDGRPSSYTLGGQTWQIGYDAGSRIAFQMNLGNVVQATNYAYDAIDRLTQAVVPTASYGFTYDATGNRTSQTIGAATQTYSVSASSNRLQSIAGSSPKTYSYDANGSITADGAGQVSTYDPRGRLTRVTVGGVTTSYQLDPLGQRIRKTGSEDTVYHYNLEGKLLSETSASGAVKKDYLWLGNQPLAVIQ